MSPADILIAAARNGRVLLVAGLVTGIALPPLADALRPWLVEMIGGVILLAAFRIGHRAAMGGGADLRFALRVILAQQVALPLAAVAALGLAGLLDTLWAAALLVMLAGAPISGSPNLTILTGGDPAPALRLMTLGTALLPLTVLPVFLASGTLGDAASVMGAAARLLGLIAVTAGAGFLIRAFLAPKPSATAIAALDGAGAILMSVLVIGLMSAAGPALKDEPARFAAWLAFCLALNFGLQTLCALILRHRPERIPVSITTGNRNLGLFLIALPPDRLDALMLFIACYQVPMYLSPLVMSRVHRLIPST